MTNHLQVSSCIVDLEPIGRRVEVQPGTNLLDAARQAGVDLVASCGGIGICGTCRVRVLSGEVSDISLTEEENLPDIYRKEGFRLACQTEVFGNCRVEIPAESMIGSQRIQVEGVEEATSIHPQVDGLDVQLNSSTINDLRADSTRINDAIQKSQYPPLQESPARWEHLSKFLRDHHWLARLGIISYGTYSKLATVVSSGTPLYGLAMDLGSTKLALYLVNLETGITEARTGVMNPQISFGEDVVSRIAFANRQLENQQLLQTRLVDAINAVITQFCCELQITVDQIVDVVAVGNTAIHHLFCGLSAASLGEAPYTPIVAEAMQFSARELGLTVASGAQIYLPPNIAGYVGADHVSALLASGFDVRSDTMLLVDIGTNTEIGLKYGDQYLCCSCASGPAFEGAHIRDGMRAAPGAIEKISFQSGNHEIITINGVPPVGICGSGILMGVSEMARTGVIDYRGVLNGNANNVRGSRGTAEFLLVPADQTGHGRDIVINRKDVNEIQLAKAAIRAGMDLLLDRAGISYNQLDRLVIAGAFGTHLDLVSAIRVGLFPDLELDRFIQIGNAAGAGAKAMLLSIKQRQAAESLAKMFEYIELTTHPDFTRVYVERMHFPKS